MSCCDSNERAALHLVQPSGDIPRSLRGLWLQIGVLRRPAAFAGSLNAVVADCIGLPVSDATFLIGLGAVYFQELGSKKKGLIWQRAAKLGPAAETYNVQKARVLLNLLKAASVAQGQACHVAVAPTPIEYVDGLQGQMLRIHSKPCRYPAAWRTDWHASVIHMDADMLVVNKPAGIPVQSHESNCCEIVPRCLEKALGLPHLHLVHRLDMWTSGVMAFALTKKAAAAFMATIRDGQLEKTYKVRMLVCRTT